MAGTVSELMEGLGIGLSIVLIFVAFPGVLESSTDVICAATKKIGKPFIKNSQQEQIWKQK